MGEAFTPIGLCSGAPNQGTVQGARQSIGGIDFNPTGTRMRATLTAVAHRVRRRGPRSRGQSLVEFALILPVFLLFFGAVLDLGRVAAAQVTVTNVAREAAFQARLTPTDFDNTQGCPADGSSNLVICRALLEAKNSPVTVAPADVSLTCDPACTSGLGNRVTVTVVGHFKLVTPILAAFFSGNQDLQFTASSTHQLETLPAASAALPTPTPSPTPTASATATPTPSPTSPACTLPSAGFTYTASPSTLMAPVTVTVQDTSTSTSCGITSWYWVINRNNSVWWFSSDQNPTVPSLSTPGTYRITLTVTNAAGSNTTGAVEVKVTG